jgi:hypothetical protein
MEFYKFLTIETGSSGRSPDYAKLEAAFWSSQNKKHINLYTALGVAAQPAKLIDVRQNIKPYMRENP